VWGELFILRTALQPRWGDAVLEAWTAADPDEKDFRQGSIAVEVKATQAGRPQSVRINGEHQLEPPAGDGSLLLVVVETDAHEGGTGETLPEAVESARSLFSGTAALKIDDRLVQRGYRDADEPAYRSTHYAARSVRWHEVAPGFPRLTAADLPFGVGDVNYLVSVDACAHWSVEEVRLTDLLGPLGGTP
jgi:hypothetical protein